MVEKTLKMHSNKKTIGHSIAHTTIPKKDGAFVEDKSFTVYLRGWNLLGGVGPKEFFWELQVGLVGGRHWWRRWKIRKLG